MPDTRLKGSRGVRTAIEICDMLNAWGVGERQGHAIEPAIDDVRHDSHDAPGGAGNPQRLANRRPVRKEQPRGRLVDDHDRWAAGAIVRIDHRPPGEQPCAQRFKISR